MRFPRRQQPIDRPSGGSLRVGPGADGDQPTLRLREGTAPSPRRRGRFLKPVPLAGLALVVVALVGYWSVYSATTERTAVLVAARDLPAGHVLRAGDLESAKIAGDEALVARLVPEATLDRIRGRELALPLSAGAPLPRAAVAARASGPASLTLVVSALHALGGALEPGDRVTVLATFQGEGGTARARALARGLEVLAVGDVPAGLGAGSASIPVTVALPDPSVATALALANSEAKIDLLREGSEGSTAAIPTAKEGGRSP